jgi:hypothetical protein
MTKVGADDLVARGATKSDLDKLPREELRRTVDTKRSAASVLARLAEAAAVFHTPAAKGYVAIPVQNHVETWPVRSKAFRGWLARQYYHMHEKPPPTQAMTETLALVEARALDGPELVAHVRVAGHRGRIYIDLANAAWQAVEVDATGWRLVSRAPIPFHRPAGMLPLPSPVPGGSLESLRQFVNAEQRETTWKLLLHWLAMALHPDGPYPVLGLTGEQGSAKSTTAHVIRALVDPNQAPLRSEPREPRDLMIAATHGWVVALDNLSSLSGWLSDCLCRLATGGGFATRELYSDEDEIIFAAKRPIIVTGIEEVVTRGDLLQRSLIVELPSIPESARRAERPFWAAFERERPAIFGALLDAVAGGLREQGGVTLAELPRMADFATWSVAVERGLGWSETFLSTYHENIDAAHEVVLEASPAVAAVRAFAVEVKDWTGTAGQLLEVLQQRVDETTRRVKGWPTIPRLLTGALRRAAPALRAVGVSVTFLPHTREGRPIRLHVKGGKASLPSSPSSQSGDWRGFSQEPPDDRNNARDDRDDRDDQVPTLTGLRPSSLRSQQDDEITV